MSLNRALPLAALAAVALASSAAYADVVKGAPVGKAACVASLDRAQSLTSARRLKSARAELVSCSAESCPDVVREDCARSLLALDATLPTVVLGAQVDGRDASDAEVVLDGEPVSLEGRSVTVDPGPHVARFQRAGRSVDVRFVAREGEKNRIVTGQFVSPVPTVSSSRVREEGRRAPVVPILLASTGAVALGGALFMRLRADGEAADLQSTCAPLCARHQRDALSDQIVVSNVALGIGVGAIALAAATYLLDPRR